MIIGMTWLKPAQGIVDCADMSLTFTHEGQQIVVDAIKRQVGCSTLSLGQFRAKMDVNNNPVFQINLGSLAINKNAKLEIEGLDDILCNYNAVFQEPPAKLPPSRGDMDHVIDLDPNAKLPAQRIYRLSHAESLELKRQLEDLLAKDWIQPSVSPFGAPVLFVQKANGRGLRLCVDYRGLNDITIKNRYGMPRIDDCLDSILNSKIFSRIDLTSGFHLIRVHPKDVHKTAFRTKYGHFEYKVMPFGLTSAPATFQRMMNEIFQDMLDHGLVCYMDDLLIHAPTPEEHNRILNEVLKRLRDNSLYLAKDKCEFGVSETSFLGHIVSKNGIKMDCCKTDIIKDWPATTSLKKLRSFLGLANYYRRFISQFSLHAAPLYLLTKKTHNWNWTNRQEEAFTHLKQILISDVVLKPPNPEETFIIFFDASNNTALGAVLCQYQEDGNLHPVAFESRMMSEPEKKYSTHEAEQAAFVHALKRWRHYLHLQRFLVFTDNISLRTIHTNEKLSDRQARWLELFQSFQFDIKHIPRDLNVVSDALANYPWEGLNPNVNA